MILTFSRGPRAEPLHVEDAKLHLRVTETDSDALIRSLITAALGYAEMFTRRQFVTATLRLTLDAFPAVIRLPRPPLASVTSIQYTDIDGVTQTLSSSDYQVDGRSEPARIQPAYGESWPSTRRELNAVTVTYVAGYATPVSVDASANTLTLLGDLTYADDDVVRLSNSGGALPLPLDEKTDYYVVSATGSTVSLSLTEGGAAITLNDAGTGTTFIGGTVPDQALSAMRLLVGHWFENREAVTLPVPARPLPMAVDSLLWALRTF